MTGYKRLLDGIGAVEQVAGVFLIALVVVTIFSQVVTRYVFNHPIVWVEETATYAFIWGAFVGAALGLKRGRHIKIDTFVAFMPPRAAATARLAIYVAIAALMIVLVRYGFQVMGTEKRSAAVSLPWAIPRMWFYSVPLTYGAASMLLTSLYVVFAEARVALALDRAPGAAAR